MATTAANRVATALPHHINFDQKRNIYNTYILKVFAKHFYIPNISATALQFTLKKNEVDMQLSFCEITGCLPKAAKCNQTSFQLFLSQFKSFNFTTIQKNGLELIKLIVL